MSGARECPQHQSEQHFAEGGCGGGEGDVESGVSPEGRGRGGVDCMLSLCPGQEMWRWIGAESKGMGRLTTCPLSAAKSASSWGLFLDQG